MNEALNEPFGFKMAMTGGLTWIASLMQGIDLTQMLGFVALVTGVFIQIASFIRNRKMEKVQDEADKRSREADERDKRQYDLQMRVLTKELQEIEARTSK